MTFKLDFTSSRKELKKKLREASTEESIEYDKLKYYRDKLEDIFSDSDCNLMTVNVEEDEDAAEQFKKFRYFFNSTFENIDKTKLEISNTITKCGIFHDHMDILREKIKTLLCEQDEEKLSAIIANSEDINDFKDLIDFNTDIANIFDELSVIYIKITSLLTNILALEDTYIENADAEKSALESHIDELSLSNDKIIRLLSKAVSNTETINLFNTTNEFKI